MRLRGICSTNTTCRPNTAWLYTIIRPVRLYGPYNERYCARDTSVDSGGLVTTAQLPNCITAARESRRNFGIARQAGTISLERYHESCRSVGHKHVPRSRFSKCSGRRRAIGPGFPESILISTALLDWITCREMQRNSRTIDHPSANVDARC